MTPDRVDVILEALLAHQPRPINSWFCICGWRPGLQLNDTESDRRQHRMHQAEMIEARLLEET